MLETKSCVSLTGARPNSGRPFLLAVARYKRLPVQGARRRRGSRGPWLRLGWDATGDRGHLPAEGADVPGQRDGSRMVEATEGG